MQDAPDRDTLLANVAMFLMAQVEPVLKAHPDGRGLAFRTRIAAHLIMTVGRELAVEDRHDAAEFARLRRMLGRPEAAAPAAAEDRRAAITASRAELASILRSEETRVDDAMVRGELMATLREQLEVVNPRFDTRMAWPGDDRLGPDATEANR